MATVTLIQAQGGDFDVTVKISANNQMMGVAVGPAARQAPARTNPLKEQAWTLTA